MKVWGRRFLALLVGGWVAVALAGNAPARTLPHVVPPPGTPDLSQMVLQPTDVSPAGTVSREGYQTPSIPAVTASYLRYFGPSTSGRTPLAAVGSEADLFTDTATATAFVEILKGLEHTRQGQRALLQPFIRGFNLAAGGSVLTFRDVHVLRVHTLSVGDESVVVPATFAVKGVNFSIDVLQVRVDRAFGEIFLGAVGRIRPHDARTLARAVAQHMRSVLG